MMQELKGKRYGLVTILTEPHTRFKYGRLQKLVHCKCLCGNEFTPLLTHVITGRSRSCGCTRKEKFTKWVEESRRMPGLSAMNGLFHTYRSGAKRRNFEFTLTLEEFYAMTQLPCAYCGIAPYQVIKQKNRNNGGCVFNGVDRVDNSMGYTPENSVPSCGVCNSMKSNRSVGELDAWVRRYVKFNHGVELPIPS